MSVGGAKPGGLRRRLGIGQDAVLGPRPRRRFKSRNARLPRRRFRGRAGRRKTCAYARNISLLRIVFPTVRVSALPCTAERLPLSGQAFSPGAAAILPRLASTPQPYHKTISPYPRFSSPLASLRFRRTCNQAQHFSRNRGTRQQDRSCLGRSSGSQWSSEIVRVS